MNRIRQSMPCWKERQHAEMAVFSLKSWEATSRKGNQIAVWHVFVHSRVLWDNHSSQSTLIGASLDSKD